MVDLPYVSGPVVRQYLMAEGYAGAELFHLWQSGSIEQEMYISGLSTF
jgi:hypothetical protein